METNSPRNNSGLKTAVLVASIIGAVAGPLFLGQVTQSSRIDRLEARVNLRLEQLDEKLQIEIRAEDAASESRHADQQVEIMRLRDRTEIAIVLEAEVQTIKSEIARLRGGG